LKDSESARGRVDVLVAERERGYGRVFDAVVAEESVLNDLYAPVMKRLQTSAGTLGRLSFTVNRVANVSEWAKRGEGLFDLRSGPFRGIGSLEREANG